MLHVLLRELDEVRTDPIADAARAGVQHEPHVIGRIETDLDEVIAGAERAEVIDIVAAADPRMLVEDRLVVLRKALPSASGRPGQLVPRAAIALAAVRAAAVRHRLLDREAQL